MEQNTPDGPLSTEKERILKTIKRRRRLLRITQAQAAGYCLVSQPQFSKKERGEQEFTLSELLALCQALDLVLDCYPAGGSAPVVIPLPFDA